MLPIHPALSFGETRAVAVPERVNHPCWKSQQKVKISSISHRQINIVHPNAWTWLLSLKGREPALRSPCILFPLSIKLFILSWYSEQCLFFLIFVSNDFEICMYSSGSSPASFLFILPIFSLFSPKYLQKKYEIIKIIFPLIWGKIIFMLVSLILMSESNLRAPLFLS